MNSLRNRTGSDLGEHEAVIETLAGIGSWTMDCQTGQMTWSAGLRTLLGLGADVAAEPAGLTACFTEPEALAEFVNGRGIDGKLRLLAYNEEFKVVLDLPDALFVDGGTTLVDFFDFNARRGEYGDGDPDEIVRQLTERSRNLQPHSFERVRPDGRVIHIRGQPLPDGSFVTIYNDITELRRAEARQILADKVFENTPEAIVILSPDKSIVSANPAFTTITGLHFEPSDDRSDNSLSDADWVIAESCRQLEKWHANGLGSLRIAINLSARQLRDRGLPLRVEKLMSQHRLGTGAIEFEITESSVMEEPTQAIAVLDALKASGASLSIDDFGTGYSSLSYLKLFPLDRLKIDRSFVSDIEHDANDAAIVGAAVSLAHNLGLRVVAEGVESATQLERLTHLGCDELQGYHLCRPLPSAAVEAFLRDNSRP